MKIFEETTLGRSLVLEIETKIQRFGKETKLTNFEHVKITLYNS